MNMTATRNTQASRGRSRDVADTYQVKIQLNRSSSRGSQIDPEILAGPHTTPAQVAMANLVRIQLNRASSRGSEVDDENPAGPNASPAQVANAILTKLRGRSASCHRRNLCEEFMERGRSTSRAPSIECVEENRKMKVRECSRSRGRSSTRTRRSATVLEENPREECAPKQDRARSRSRNVRDRTRERSKSRHSRGVSQAPAHNAREGPYEGMVIEGVSQGDNDCASISSQTWFSASDHRRNEEFRSRRSIHDDRQQQRSRSLSVHQARYSAREVKVNEEEQRAKGRELNRLNSSITTSYSARESKHSEEIKKAIEVTRVPPPPPPPRREKSLSRRDSKYSAREARAEADHARRHRSLSNSDHEVLEQHPNNSDHRLSIKPEDFFRSLSSVEMLEKDMTGLVIQTGRGRRKSKGRRDPPCKADISDSTSVTSSSSTISSISNTSYMYYC